MWKEPGEYANFFDYSDRRWGFKRAYTYNLLTTARVSQEIGASTTVDIQPENERQVRELSRSDDPVTVWGEIVEQHAPEDITAAVIREHVQRAEAPATAPVSLRPAPVPESTSDRILRELHEAVLAALQIATAGCHGAA